MAGATKRSFDEPDERRSPDKTAVDVLTIGDITYSRTTFQPGWRWSECVKPVAGTEKCQSRHIGAAVSGRLHVTHEDGSELDLGPGDAFTIEPGHDAWVVGDEPYVAFEITGDAYTYAKPS
jgi:hypothetical protein